MNDHQFKEEERESVGELSTVCSKIILKCLCLDRVGRPDNLCAVNKLARAVTSGPLLVACAWRVGSHTFMIQVNTGIIVKWETLHNNAGYDYVKDSDFAGDFKTQNQHLKGSCVFSEVTHLCRKDGCARNRLQFHTVLPEVEIISLDAGFTLWTVFPVLIVGIWLLKYFIRYRTELMDIRESYGETRQQLSSLTCVTLSQSST